MVQPINTNSQFLIRGSRQTAPISQSIETTRSGKREILQESFLSVSEKIPSLKIISPVGGFRINNAKKFLINRFGWSGLPAVDYQDRHNGFSDVKIATLEKLRISFKNLEKQTFDLSREGELQTRFAKSSRPEFLEAKSIGDGPSGKFTVVPSRATTQNVLVSNKQDRPFSALGLTGSFFINGTKINVKSTDSIVQLRDKINFGEDANMNGRLDLLEDVNANGVLEVHQREPSEFGSGIFVIEDINGNGILDPTEDENNNGRLDGGSNENRVSADILRDRLFLTSLAERTRKIDVRDPNKILQFLGFFEKDSKGNPIQKQTQIDFSKNPPEELIKRPQKALMEVENDILSGDSNTFENAIKGAHLEIKKPVYRNIKITISVNSTQAAQIIERFFTAFNNTVRELNSILAYTREFERDRDVQKLRRGLLGEAQEKILRIGKRNEIKEAFLYNRKNQNIVGLNIYNHKKSTVEEVALGQTIDKIKNGISSPFTNPGPETLRRLNSVGIQTNADDTIRVNSFALKEAMEINKDTVLDILNNPDTGLLPKLQPELSRILKEDLGDISLKQVLVSMQSEIPEEVSKGFKKLSANNTLNGLVGLIELDGRGLNLDAIA